MNISTFVFQFLLCLGVLSGYALVVNQNGSGAAGLVISIGSVAMGILILKTKAEDSPSDWKWLAASINNALQV
jgi:hypothetical protein